MQLLLVISFAVISQVFGAVEVPKLNKCDDDAIKWVKVIWKAIGEPSDLVSKRDKDGKIGIIASTSDYIDHPECQYAEFEGKSATWTIVTEEGEKAEFKEYFTEEGPIVTSSDGSVKRYFVFSKGGVDAFYVCSADGPEGDPQGAVSVVLDKLQAKDADTIDLVDFAADLLGYVGVGVNVTSYEKCFKKA